MKYSDRLKCTSCDGSGSRGEIGCTDCLGKGLDPSFFAGGIEEALNDAYEEGRKEVVLSKNALLRIAMEAMLNLHKGAVSVWALGGSHETSEVIAAIQAELSQSAVQPDALRMLTENDVLTLIGHAEYLKIAKGQQDMPDYFYKLAERIALTIGDKPLADRTGELAATNNLTMKD